MNKRHLFPPLLVFACLAASGLSASGTGYQGDVDGVVTVDVLDPDGPYNMP